MIVKIQVSLTEPDSVLIYNQNRSAFGQVPLTPDLKKRMGGSLKAYFKARRNSDGLLQIGQRVRDQDW